MPMEIRGSNCQASPAEPLGHHMNLCVRLLRALAVKAICIESEQTLGYCIAHFVMAGI